MTKIYWFLGHEQFQPEVLVKHAQLAEKAGFDGVMTSEHFHPWVDDVGAGGFAFATLGAISQATNLELMTAVTTPLWRYHPAIVAQAAATLSRLSGGKFSLGVGTGENINEGPLGYAFPGYAERAARMTEAIEIMTRLLAGEKVTFNGKFYSTDSARLYSPPTTHVPIYLAAGGPKSATLAGAMTDGVIASVKSVDDTNERVIAPLRESAKSSGRPDPKLICSHWTVRGASDDEAWEALKPWRGLRAPSRLKATDPATLRGESDGMERSEVLERYTRVHSADDYVRVYGAIVRELAPDIIGIQTTSTNQEDTLRMMADEVVPELTKRMQKGN
jgi:coenzyme F420-dependent glucose-6-phosphate dehydrogenase